VGIGSTFLPMDLGYLRSIGLPVCPRTLCSSSREASGLASGVEVSPDCCKEWEALQNRLRLQVKDTDDVNWQLRDLKRVGGLDISFENGTNKGTAVLVICEVGTDANPALQLVYEDAIDVDMDLPYVSGFLFVRELPGYKELLRRLRAGAPHLEPEIFLVDGSGVFHPRQLGSASHLGVEADLRTIGVAKKLMLIGDDFDKEAAQKVEETELSDIGDYVEIVGAHTKRLFGMALRTSAITDKKKKQSEVSSRRVYISVGHRVSLSTARDVVLQCSDVAGGSYIPEPIRLADLTGRAIERAWQQLHASSAPPIRQLVLDICNLLDDKQRRTLHGILEGRDPLETLATIPEAELKRRRAVIEELFIPFREMYPAATVQEVRVAVKMEKPWAVALKKAGLVCQACGDSMKASRGEEAASV